MPTDRDLYWTESPAMRRASLLMAWSISRPDCSAGSNPGQVNYRVRNDWNRRIKRWLSSRGASPTEPDPDIDTENPARRRVLFMHTV